MTSHNHRRYESSKMIENFRFIKKNEILTKTFFSGKFARTKKADHILEMAGQSASL